MSNKLNQKRKQLRKTIEDIDYKEKAKELLGKRTIKILIVVFCVVLFFVSCHLYKTYKTYDGYDVKDTIKIKSGDSTEIEPFGKFICMYSRNGISYIDEHDSVWNESHEMKNPMVDVCQNYLAITDKNTNTIFVYNKSGKQGEITTSYPVVKMEVAKQGVVAVLLRNNDVNYIEMFDKDGTLLVSHKTLLTDNGYPLNFTLSDDGKQIIVSYVNLQNGVVSNKVSVYDFGDRGKDKKDRVLKQFDEFKDQVVPTVAYVGDDYVWAVGEHMVSMLTVGSNPRVKDSVKIKDDIHQVFYSRDYMGLIFETDDDKHPYKVKVYNKSLKMVMETYIDMNYSDIAISGDNVLVYNGSSAKLISMKGVKKFDYHFKKAISKIIPLNDEEYLIKRKNELQRVTLD